MITNGVAVLNNERFLERSECCGGNLKIYNLNWTHTLLCQAQDLIESSLTCRA